jgi:hypothetical protein
MFVDPEHPEKSQERLRDGEGKFVPKGTPPEETATKKVEVTGPIEVIKEAIKDPSIDKPLLSITVNNPFRKLLQWIKEIKNKQTTTFEFKVKVPLIALPVFLVVLGSAFTFFFNLGKDSEKQNTKISTLPSPVVSTIPTVSSVPYLTSRVGIVKGTYQVLAAESDNLTPTSTPLPPTPTPTLTPTPTPPLSRFVLLDKDEKITFILSPLTIKMENYLNRRVLINGMYDPNKNTIKIVQTRDIEILP